MQFLDLHYRNVDSTASGVNKIMYQFQIHYSWIFVWHDDRLVEVDTSSFEKVLKVHLTICKVIAITTGGNCQTWHIVCNIDYLCHSGGLKLDEMVLKPTIMKLSPQCGDQELFNKPVWRASHHKRRMESTLVTLYWHLFDYQLMY